VGREQSAATLFIARHVPPGQKVYYCVALTADRARDGCSSYGLIPGEERKSLELLWDTLRHQAKERLIGLLNIEHEPLVDQDAEEVKEARKQLLARVRAGDEDAKEELEEYEHKKPTSADEVATEAEEVAFEYRSASSNQIAQASYAVVLLCHMLETYKPTDLPSRYFTIELKTTGESLIFNDLDTIIHDQVYDGSAAASSARAAAADDDASGALSADDE
jgi:hypothetical protein